MKTRQLDYEQFGQGFELCGIVTCQRHLPNNLLQTTVAGICSFMICELLTGITASALASLQSKRYAHL